MNIKCHRGARWQKGRFLLVTICAERHLTHQGWIQGGGVFWGTPKLHKEGKNVARVHILVLNSYPDPPPCGNPVSVPAHYVI